MPPSGCSVFSGLFRSDLVKGRHVRLNVIFKGKEVKKLFLVFLILVVGLVGVSAIPNRPGGGYKAPQSI
jgi:hypothetical protein